MKLISKYNLDLLEVQGGPWDKGNTINQLISLSMERGMQIII